MDQPTTLLTQLVSTMGSACCTGGVALSFAHDNFRQRQTLAVPPALIATASAPRCLVQPPQTMVGPEHHQLRQHIPSDHLPKRQPVLAHNIDALHRES
jgi:hypothetical protein